MVALDTYWRRRDRRPQAQPQRRQGQHLRRQGGVSGHDDFQSTRDFRRRNETDGGRDEIDHDAADDDADDETGYNDDKDNISGVKTESRDTTTSNQRETLDDGNETDGGRDEIDDYDDDDGDDETDDDDETAAGANWIIINLGVWCAVAIIATVLHIAMVGGSWASWSPVKYKTSRARISFEFKTF